MKLWGGIVAVLLFLALRWYLNDTYGKVVGAATSNRAECLSMLGSTTNEKDGGTYIVGSVRNNCDHPILSVTVTFKMQQGYGPNSQWREGNAYAYVSDVKAGETRKFKSAIPVGKNSIIRFDKIIAY